MRLFILPLTLVLVTAAGSTAAQSQGGAAAAAQSLPARTELLQKDEQPPLSGRDRAVRRLHVEDAAMAIDEVRYGGETQSITVTPKSGGRPYQIVPSDGARNFPGALGAAAGPAGQRVWKLVDF